MISRPITNPRAHGGRPCARLIGAFLIMLAQSLRADEGGALLGTVTDPSGTAVAGAKVTATEHATRLKRNLTTDSHGFYSFQSLPVGHYDVEIEAPGFKPLRRTGVEIDIDSKLVVDVSLSLGERSEAVTVSASAVHVETADTQKGEVISGTQMTTVPLNG